MKYEDEGGSEVDLFDKPDLSEDEEDESEEEIDIPQPKKTVDKDGNITIEDVPAVDVSDKKLEKMARGYFLGKAGVGRKHDVRRELEDKVIGKIGKKGKFLTDKLFELIEGVYVVDKIKPVKGKDQIRYYKVPPNLNAIIYALDRVLGKPKQVQLTGSFSLSKLLIETKKSEEGEPSVNVNVNTDGKGA